VRNHPAAWRVAVKTSAEAEEAVSELLANTFGGATSSYTDVQRGGTTVAIFLETKPDWSKGLPRELRAGLRRIKGFGLDIGAAQLTLQKVPPQDWAESWKRHFQPIEIGRTLLIKPSWSARRPRAGQAVVVIDPGLSFGTGQHATTAYCLKQLVACRKPAQAQGFLDLGTGSGILAIAAAKLGYGPILALDFDSEAIRTARANARHNGVANQIVFLEQDVTQLPEHKGYRYPVVCANLISSLLLTERSRILARLERGGRLIIAGILRTEFAEVQRGYEKAGLRLAGSRVEREWRSGTFAMREA
jgi:ribosomal protein L11 methyltransferase